jgi:ornithine cyclodeaminase/alanine dehydrogenase-like protein (mu-crystallin family)
MLVLSGRDVHDLLSFADCADLMRTALVGLHNGDIQMPLRTVARPEGAAGFMGLMPSYSGQAGFGLKALVICPGNPARGLDAHQGGVLLFSADTGEPLAMVNASAITEIRTAAVSAVATGLLARADATEAAIIGTGVQGLAHARALAATGKLTSIRIVAREFSRAERTAGDLAAELDVPVAACEAVPAALDGAGIVVTATSSPVPVLRRDWLAAGAHVNAVGACVRTDRELDTDTMAAAVVFADRRESLVSEAGDYLLALADGADVEVRAELGEVLAGVAPGRSGPAELTVFKSLGLAAEDLLAARYVYEKALALGAGTPADF